MFEQLRGKRLLVLGGIRALCEPVKLAREMGIYTVVTDYLPDSPAKKFADKACMVSTTDVDAVVRLCREERIDGVFTAYIDSMLPYARAVCDRLGLPFYASHDQIRMSLDKKYFKEVCRRFGVPVASDYTAQVSRGDLTGIEYPVIVKPVDSSGGRGITVCRDAGQLKTAWDYAMTVSPGKNVLAEQYIEGGEVTATYTMKDGEISLSGFKDKHISRDHPDITALTDVLIFPSVHLERYARQVDPLVREMLRGMGARDGTVFLQGIASPEKIAFFELGYRPNGAADWRVFERVNGINFMKMLIAHALTGQMLGYELSLDDPFFPCHCLTYNLFGHGGVIGEMSGLAQVQALPGVEIAEYMRNVGDTVVDNNTLAQRVFRAVIRGKTLDEVKQTILAIQSIVRVRDTEGKDMLYLPFDPDRLTP